MPKSKRHYHAMLIKEINSVMRHLNSSPPRKYSFDEWAWYLKLIGEDESSPETHRKAIHKPKHTNTSLGTNMGRKMDEEETVKWSWVGNRSPLMGNKEEAEWVLERLTKTLERELEAMRREEEEGKGDWAPGEEMEGKEPIFRHRDRNESYDKEGVEEKGDKLRTGQVGPSIESSRTTTEEREGDDDIEREKV
jgi:potassium channel subfamily K, other eukaryote